ncbi:MAG: hypothetical protein R2909_04775 [Gemmatimonadales bacterium]
MSITLRGSLARTVLPVTAYDGATDTVGAVRRFLVALPRLDARFGIIAKPLPVGTVSADFLASVILIPKGATEDVRFGPEVRSIGDVALGFGYGIRIAIEAQRAAADASPTSGRTALPTFGYGDLSAGSTYAYTRFRQRHQCPAAGREAMGQLRAHGRWWRGRPPSPGAIR